jgi:hypothetical protein
MMTHREENKRLREEGHAGHGHGHGHSSQYGNTPSDTHRDRDDESRGGKSKKARTTPGDHTYDSGGRLVQKKGDTSTVFLDPVQLGLCSEAEGREMFDRYVWCK